MRVSTVPRYPSHSLITTPYCTHPSGPCVPYSYWIVHEARSVIVSDICRAASRCESSGNEAAHAQPAFVSMFYVLPDHTLVDHQISSSICGFGSPSQVTASGLWNFVGRVQLHDRAVACPLRSVCALIGVVRLSSSVSSKYLLGRYDITLCL